MKSRPIRITMLMAKLGLTGTPRMMMDIISNINHGQFEITVAHKPELATSELDLVDELKELGIKLVPLRGKKLFSLAGIMDLHKQVSTDSIDILHCWDALGITARILRLFSRFKVIQSYCNPVVSKGSFMFYWVNKLTSLLIDGVIFCTRGVRESYQQTKTIFMQRKKIALITNCIKVNSGKESELDHKKIREDWKINEHEKVLTNIGYFNKQKGQVYLLDSLKNVLSELPQVKLFLVGWGPLETTLRKKAKELGIVDNIIFTGKCQRQRVFEILSITDIFVLPSLWEGFGLVLGEAMAMAKPVVCTKTDGSQVVVKHEETGIIVPPKDPRAFANAVIDLINDPDRAQKMGELGKQRVATLFSPERFIQEHEAFYREIILQQ